VTDRHIVTAVFDYRLCQSIIDNRFLIQFRIIDNRFTPLDEGMYSLSAGLFFTGNIYNQNALISSTYWMHIIWKVNERIAKERYRLYATVRCVLTYLWLTLCRRGLCGDEPRTYSAMLTPRVLVSDACEIKSTEAGPWKLPGLCTACWQQTCTHIKHAV